MFNRDVIRTQSPAEQARQQGQFKTSTAAQYRREADDWFDGTAGSVDRRIAMCDRLLAVARTGAARQGPDLGARLAEISRLEADQTGLGGLRHDLLTGAADRESAVVGHDRLTEHADRMQDWHRNGVDLLSSQDRRYVALESAKFLAANPGVSGEELATRARHHAEVQTSTYSQDRSRSVTAAFVAQVGQLQEQAPRPRVASAPAPVPDCPAEMMFL